jgi:predicted acylesterase/phospholipase RssA
VVAGLLANGFTIDDAMMSIAGMKGGRIPPLSLNIFRLGLVNRQDLRTRARQAVRGVASALWNRATGRGRALLEGLFIDYSDLIGPPLTGEPFERLLRDVFGAPGRTNDFRKLPRRLFVGATDQDLRTHVLFGSPGLDEVPISLAIQASVSLNPAFCSAAINGRYFSDGGVTVTAHVTEAIGLGAGLLLIIDPFVPYVAKEPGYVRKRGFLYSIDQDVRTLAYTRYERVREAALRAKPSVSSYTFLPANTLRKVMGINPMDHRPYMEIWRGAYLSTLRRLEHLRYRMSGDLEFRGLKLHIERARDVAERLTSTATLKLADFYPEGRLPAPLPSPSLPKKR